MRTVLSGRAMVWTGVFLAISGLVLLILGDRLLRGGPLAGAGNAIGGGMVIAGVVIEIVGIFRRAGDAERALAALNFSQCNACGYPFDGHAKDSATVTCSECGRRFSAGEAREWNRMHPERVPRNEH